MAALRTVQATTCRCIDRRYFSRMEEEAEASQPANLSEIAQQLAQLAAALRMLKDQPIDGSRSETATGPANDDAGPVVDG